MAKLTKTEQIRNAKQIAFYVSLDKAEDAPIRAALRQVELEERNLSALLRKGLVLALAIETRNLDVLEKMLPIDVVRELMPAPAPLVVEVKMPEWKNPVQLPLPLPEPLGKEEFAFEIEDGAEELVARNLKSFEDMFE